MAFPSNGGFGSPFGYGSGTGYGTGGGYGLGGGAPNQILNTYSNGADGVTSQLGLDTEENFGLALQNSQFQQERAAINSKITQALQVATDAVTLIKNVNTQIGGAAGL